MNLLDLMSVEYRRSRWALYASLASVALIYLAVFGDAITSHKWSERLALAAFLIQIISILLKSYSSKHYDSAEEIRRAAVLSDGLGIQPNELQVSEIVARAGVGTPPKRLVSGQYFASEKPKGLQRFLEDIAESAFWTHHVSECTSRGGFLLVGIGVLLCFIALVQAVESGVGAGQMKAFAESVIVTLGFVVTGELLILSLQYQNLSKRACAKLETAGTLLSLSSADREASLLLFGEYNCTLAGAPPLPTFVYTLLQSRLNAAWSARKENLSVQ
jgi:hypothetical protein